MITKMRQKCEISTCSNKDKQTKSLATTTGNNKTNRYIINKQTCQHLPQSNHVLSHLPTGKTENEKHYRISETNFMPDNKNVPLLGDKIRHEYKLLVCWWVSMAMGHGTGTPVKSGVSQLPIWICSHPWNVCLFEQCTPFSDWSAWVCHEPLVNHQQTKVNNEIKRSKKVHNTAIES